MQQEQQPESLQLLPVEKWPLHRWPSPFFFTSAGAFSLSAFCDREAFREAQRIKMDRMSEMRETRVAAVRMRLEARFLARAEAELVPTPKRRRARNANASQSPRLPRMQGRASSGVQGARDRTAPRSLYGAPLPPTPRRRKIDPEAANAAATRIQAHARGRLERGPAGRRSRSLHLAVAMQSFWRARSARAIVARVRQTVEARERARRRRAVQRIQGAYRTFRSGGRALVKQQVIDGYVREQLENISSALSEFDAMRQTLELESVVVIQRWWRQCRLLLRFRRTIQQAHSVIKAQLAKAAATRRRKKQASGSGGASSIGAPSRASRVSREMSHDATPAPPTGPRPSFRPSGRNRGSNDSNSAA
jgi:hypothetical protein